ncbi:hypothetical protein CA54_28410 [Symmachiella macrocystis]|uniref:Uncharacterized protein n=1 Tax=Symmachiella macrocystis TaxID=2527985 RepID=A0A5C6BSZ0_9PLAN|nr:hypothetical protein CA54_28410 [Symmachiella macrocystis]
MLVHTCAGKDGDEFLPVDGPIFSGLRLFP